MSVVLITGASRGIGRAMVERFAREGCTVVACARGEAGLAELRVDAVSYTHLDVYKRQVSKPSLATHRFGIWLRLAGM